MKIKKVIKILFVSLVLVFLVLNIIAVIQAYSFTHFSDTAQPLKRDINISAGEKFKAAIFGMRIPRPQSSVIPDRAFDSLLIPVDSIKMLDAWVMHTDSISKGIVLLFHGYMDDKSTMLDRAYIMLDMGYDVLLADFMGAGDSYGDQTTIGYLEADNVNTVYNYVLRDMKREDIYMLGFSMGAVAVMKAVNDNNMLVRGLILEAPYATFVGTIENRFDQLGVPAFPMVQLMTFWGGKMNGFDAFSMNPVEFAHNIKVPVLLMCGLKDPNVSIEETQYIYANLGCDDKNLLFFDESKHESYLLKHQKEWKHAVSIFLERQKQRDDIY